MYENESLTLTILGRFEYTWLIYIYIYTQTSRQDLLKWISPFGKHVSYQEYIHICSNASTSLRSCPLLYWEHYMRKKNKKTLKNNLLYRIQYKTKVNVRVCEYQFLFDHRQISSDFLAIASDYWWVTGDHLETRLYTHVALTHDAWKSGFHMITGRLFREKLLCRFTLMKSFSSMKCDP